MVSKSRGDWEDCKQGGDRIRPSIMTQRQLTLLTGKGPDQGLRQGQGQGKRTPLPYPDFPIVTDLLLWGALWLPTDALIVKLFLMTYSPYHPTPLMTLTLCPHYDDLFPPGYTSFPNPNTHLWPSFTTLPTPSIPLDPPPPCDPFCHSSASRLW